MKKRRVFSAVLSMVMIFGMMSIHVVAAETAQLTPSQVNRLVISYNAQIMEESFEKLLDDAIANKEQEYNVEVIQSSNGEDKLEVRTYIIQDKVLSINSDTNSELCAITYASEISLRDAGNKYEEGWDGAYAVKAYSTLYYTNQNYQGNTTSCLTKVTGGYTKKTGVSVSSQSVTYGMSGIGPGGVVNLSGKKYPGGSSWTYNTGFSKYVATASSSHIGCTYTLVIKRGYGTYNYELFNEL